jgi:hypothetical protein
MYCIYFTIYRGLKLPPFYIGSTSIKRIQQGYHGSVSSAKWEKIWKTELVERPDLFETIIIPNQFAESAKEIVLLEQKWQKLFDVVNSPLFINQSYANKGFFASPESARKAMETKKRRGTNKLSPETIAKIIAKNTGKKRGPLSDETKKKLSLVKKGVYFI